MLNLILSLFLNIALAGEPVKVAVIDTGLDLKDPRFSKVLCKTGHKDFTGEGLKDTIGHGTHVAGIIMANSKSNNYCMIILKYYSNNLSSNQISTNTIRAYEHAIKNNARIINYSSNGPRYIMEEDLIIKKNSSTLFVVAAGNEGVSLDTNPMYPAVLKYNNLITVGNLNVDGRVSITSNYGSNVKVWEIGTDINSTLPENKYGKLSGTSMATAIQTSKIITDIYSYEKEK